MFHKRFHPKFIPKYLNVSFLYSRSNAPFQKKAKIHHDLIGNTMKNVQINSVKDWDNVRRAIIDHDYNRGQYNDNNIDAMILGHCASSKNFELGLSYISFLENENIKPNLATRSKYLKLLYYINEESCLISAKKCAEETLIVKYYSDLRKEYPILDSFTLESAVLALSVTSEWKTGLELIKEIKLTSVPTNAAYSAVVAAAFLNKEENIAWELLTEMLENNRVPQNIAFLTYFGTIQRMKEKEGIFEKLETLFSFFQENDLKCDQQVAQALSRFGKKVSLTNPITSVTHKGICKNCRTKLDNFDLGEEEFEDLKNKLFKNVIIGKDLFVKSNPEELQRFTDFVRTMGRFDVVLDGLNIAYSAGTRQPPQILSAMVAAVVSHFVIQKKKVLVLGRVHMNRWPRRNWGYITENATVFLTQNISQDDPYLLYCALNSGRDTIIVTRDLMRSHKSLLKNPRDKMLFNRWLSRRQYQLLRVNEEHRPIFRMPPPYSMVAQKNNSGWHIPFVDESGKEKSEVFNWLCLKV